MNNLLSKLNQDVFVVGDDELVLSETGFKLGDVPCIFGEYKVDEAMLRGDPIPESTECG